MFPVVYFTIILFYLVEKFFSLIIEASFLNKFMLFLFHFWYLFLRTSFYNFWFLFPGYYIVAHFFEVFKYIFEIYSIHWVVSVSPGSLFLLLWVEIYLCAMSRAYALESFAESWMINELIFAGSIPNVSILMYLLMGSSF